MKKIILLTIILSNIHYLVAQSLNPISEISSFGSADTFSAGYTFSYSSAGTPWSGALISFGGFQYNNYDCQISSDYGPNGGNHLSFRTRNGDNATWNSWNELATRGTNNYVGNQSIIGNLGIGTTLPETLLNVNVGSGGSNGVAGIRVGGLYNYSSLEFGIDGDYDGMIRSFGNNIKYYAGHWKTKGTAATENHSHNWYTSRNGSADWSIIKMILNENGNLGIGTASPDEKLTVKGKIHTQEVRVDMDGSLVPDYVFANDYKLKSLQEVEDFIKENKHLPEIPSANEIEKNGLMLAEMNMHLLKKIEELTLYSIEQNKKIELQIKEIETLKDLALRVAKIEHELSKKQNGNEK